MFFAEAQQQVESSQGQEHKFIFFHKSALIQWINYECAPIRAPSDGDAA